MRSLQQSKIATLPWLKGKNSKEGAYTRDAGEVLIAILTIEEEVSHSLGHQLMVVQDEASLGAINTFAAKQGAGREATKDLDKDIVHEVGQCVTLVVGLFHFIVGMQ